MSGFAAAKFRITSDVDEPERNVVASVLAFTLVVRRSKSAERSPWGRKPGTVTCPFGGVGRGMSGNFPAADTFGENKLGKLLAIREMRLSFMAIFLRLRLEVAPMARFYKPLPESSLQKSQVVTLIASLGCVG